MIHDSELLRKFGPKSIPPEPSKLFFVHVGKTGGVTLRSILRNIFSPEEFLSIPYKPEEASGLGLGPPINMPLRLAEIRPAKFERVRFMGGHYTIGIDQFCDSAMRYLTMVRDPVDRVVSSFYYLKKIPGTVPFRLCEEPGYDLKRYVTEGRGLDTSDYQTRFLSGDPALDGTWDDAPFLCETGVSDLSLLALKLKILSKFLMIAPTDEFDACLVVLSEIYGWPLENMKYTRKNVTSKRPKASLIDDNLRVEIEKRNQKDMALFRFAKSHFQMLKATIPDFDAKLERFSAMLQ